MDIKEYKDKYENVDSSGSESELDSDDQLRSDMMDIWHIPTKKHTKECMRRFQNFLALESNQNILNHYNEFNGEQEKDQAVFSRIDAKCKALNDVTEIEQIKTQAHFLEIYHSVVIEGNASTLTETELILNKKMQVSKNSKLDYKEIICLDAAIQCMKSTLVNTCRPITKHDLLHVHWNLMEKIQVQVAGIYRKEHVSVGEHITPSWYKVPILMENWFQWLNSKHSVDLHPVWLAALTHLSLVYVHPFVDGNGRISRLMMNLILVRNGFPPVVIRHQDRLLYYECLRQAQQTGNVFPFIRFVAKCTERTLDMYLTCEDVYKYDESLPPLTNLEDC